MYAGAGLYSEARRSLREYAGNVSIRKVRLNQGGYTDDGIYFGVGKPLYYFQDEDGFYKDYLRASDRADAIEQVRDFYPTAKIRK